MDDQQQGVPRGGIADDIYTKLLKELGDNAPARSVVGSVLRLYEDRRAAAAPALVEASLTEAAMLIAQTRMPFALPGGGRALIEKLGEHAALDILGRLQQAGIRLMIAAPE